MCGPWASSSTMLRAGCVPFQGSHAEAIAPRCRNENTGADPCLPRPDIYRGDRASRLPSDSQGAGVRFQTAASWRARCDRCEGSPIPPRFGHRAGGRAEATSACGWEAAPRGKVWAAAAAVVVLAGLLVVTSCTGFHLLRSQRIFPSPSPRSSIRPGTRSWIVSTRVDAGTHHGLVRIRQTFVCCRIRVCYRSFVNSLRAARMSRAAMRSRP